MKRKLVSRPDECLSESKDDCAKCTDPPADLKPRCCALCVSKQRFRRCSRDARDGGTMCAQHARMQAKGLIGCGSQKTRTEKTLALLFGFNRFAKSDITRTKLLQNKFGFDVITVSDGQGSVTDTDKPHIQSFFGSERSTASILKSLEEFMTSHSDKTYEKVVIYLDYWWLENNYYEERYSKNWLMGKHPFNRHAPRSVRFGLASKFLNGGVSELVLPIDAGERNQKMSMDNMLDEWVKSKDKDQLNVQRIPMTSHPLWVVTEAADAEDLDGRDNDTQTLNYLVNDQPSTEFISITLA